MRKLTLGTLFQVPSVIVKPLSFLITAAMAFPQTAFALSALDPRGNRESRGSSAQTISEQEADQNRRLETLQGSTENQGFQLPSAESLNAILSAEDMKDGRVVNPATPGQQAASDLNDRVRANRKLTPRGPARLSPRGRSPQPPASLPRTQAGQTQTTMHFTTPMDVGIPGVLATGKSEVSTRSTGSGGVQVEDARATIDITDGTKATQVRQRRIQPDGSWTETSVLTLSEGTKLESVTRMAGGRGTTSSMLTKADGTVVQTESVLDAAGRVTQSRSTGPEGTTLRTDYTYDANGRLTGFKEETRKETRTQTRFDRPADLGIPGKLVNETTRVSREKTVDGVKAIQTDDV
ncbi:MAG: hypothetical protein IPP68_12035 [Elusimicrobia bacterium]|nr:hypothetical protein [Elusimicrobiota bacterium]